MRAQSGSSRNGKNKGPGTKGSKGPGTSRTTSPNLRGGKPRPSRAARSEIMEDGTWVRRQPKRGEYVAAGSPLWSKPTKPARSNRKPKGEDGLWGPAKRVAPKRKPKTQTSVPARNTGGAGRRKPYPPAVRGAVNIPGFDYGRSTI